MFRIYIALLALIAGVTATELCDMKVDIGTFREVCYNDDLPKEFPGTAEELEKFCTFAIRYFECGAEYANRCDNSDLLDETIKYLRIFQEICNKETLSYTALVVHLECVNEIIMEDAPQECHRQLMTTSEETLQKYTEVLYEEGLLAVGNDDNNTLKIMACIQLLQELAFYATKIKDKCGSMASHTYVEITQKFSRVETCGETYQYLPAIIRVYELQKEEANENEEVFKKRK